MSRQSRVPVREAETSGREFETGMVVLDEAFSTARGLGTQTGFLELGRARERDLRRS